MLALPPLFTISSILRFISDLVSLLGGASSLGCVILPFNLLSKALSKSNLSSAKGELTEVMPFFLCRAATFSVDKDCARDLEGGLESAEVFLLLVEVGVVKGELGPFPTDLRA